MNDLNRVELAIRRAASQMPNHQARAFRLLADEIARFPENVPESMDETNLQTWRQEQQALD